MPIDPAAITKAQKAGYSDTEILDHLAQTDPRVKTARDAGYDDGEIIAHLGTTPAAPKDTSALSGIVLGAVKPIDKIATALLHYPAIKTADDWVANKLGMRNGTQEVEANDAGRANNTRTNFQTIGNIVGTLPAMRLPGGPLVQGAVSGALLSDKKDIPGVLGDAAISGVLSKGSSMIGNGLSYLAKPVVSRGARILADAGIPLTIGQIAAGGKGFVSNLINKGEEALTSAPFLGDMINSARARGTEGFNLALGNRILSNIGKTLKPGTEAGSEMVESVGKTISNHYNALVPSLKGTFDKQFGQDISAARQSIKTLPNAQQKQFMNILRDVFGNRAVVNGAPSAAGGTSFAIPGQATGQTVTISGQALKDAESRLTFLMKKYQKSPDPDQSILGDALDKARDALRSMVQRNNPEHASELKAINKAWAQFKTLETASEAPGNATGVVTPAQALAASRLARVKDPLVKAAKAILPNTTPDSGTARRGAMTIGAMALGGGTGAATISPAFAAPAAGSLLYTKTGQAALNKLIFAPRGPMATRAEIALKALAKTAPVVAPPILAANRGQ